MWSDTLSSSRHASLMKTIEALYDEVERASAHERASGDMISDDRISAWSKRVDGLRARLGPATLAVRKTPFTGWWMLDAIDQVCEGT